MASRIENKPTFCRICEPLCGMIATVEDGRLVALRPDKDHPLSSGFAALRPDHRASHGDQGPRRRSDRDPTWLGAQGHWGLAARQPGWRSERKSAHVERAGARRVAVGDVLADRSAGAGRPDLITLTAKQHSGRSLLELSLLEHSFGATTP
jgi:Molybdopterin oxidoreductase Fe4S4 domain